MGLIISIEHFINKLIKYYQMLNVYVTGMGKYERQNNTMLDIYVGLSDIDQFETRNNIM